MRFAITAFNRKCIDAEEFNFELNNKLLIVCPNKGCSSPLTYVRTIDGQRYFRHPRRKKKELEDPKFQCERRAKGISAKAVKSYNKIVEQTTIQQFQKNFYISLLILAAFLLMIENYKTLYVQHSSLSGF